MAVLAYNCVEWAELYAATAKAGLVAVPINFRLVGPESRCIVTNAEAAALSVQDELAGVVEEVRADLGLPEGHVIHFGAPPCPKGYRDYEAFLAAASAAGPDVAVGWVTMLHPHEQFTKLGSVGRECVGSAPIRILDEDGNEVPDGEAGELYSCNPYTFDGYWKLPEKTAAAFRGAYCTVGDMARRDADGFIQLVDRKSNMIISGGENVYPSEVEAAVGGHPLVQDVAVVGLPDVKWGELVHAVVVLHPGTTMTEADLSAWSRDRLAGYKRPRSYSFVAAEALPRNATGKVLYRVLKEQLAARVGAPA